VSCASHSLAFRRIPEAIGFNIANLASDGALCELASTSMTPLAVTDTAAALFKTLGLHVEHVQDGPGLVLGRVLAQIVNEAAFARSEGLASVEDIDVGVTLGLGYPRGSLAWGAEIGWESVLQTLNGIWEERRQERYRPAPALIKAAAGEAV
jgi:3-hydroxybutyryl-CoA dehydrogenase